MADQPNQSVSLGCGSLILIAIIVLIFGSQGSNKDIEKRLDEMDKKLDRIEKLLEAKT
ncbi:MAG: hypothetical protein ACSHYF_10335 [Verrucomicrobiaceae bacterium]